MNDRSNVELLSQALPQADPFSIRPVGMDIVSAYGRTSWMLALAMHGFCNYKY